MSSRDRLEMRLALKINEQLLNNKKYFSQADLRLMLLESDLEEATFHRNYLNLEKADQILDQIHKSMSGPYLEQPPK